MLITGGSGFLGRAIMREWPNEDFIVYSRDEYKQDLCRRRFPDAGYIIGDITDPIRLQHAFKDQDIIIHAAAMKYIPEAEHNVMECIRVNLMGTQNVLEAAHKAGVERVVCISTDKAASPINVYGMTKALTERLCAEYARLNGTKYTAVRYGNVVGSTGSVIPWFQKQLHEKGRLSVTDPHMTRFWISYKKAVELIGLALEAESGRIIVPKASSMTLIELATVIAGEAPIDIIGPRPGEKRHELLIAMEESVRAENCFDHYEIGDRVVREDGFIISSNTAEHLIKPDEMREMIKEAQCV